MLVTAKRIWETIKKLALADGWLTKDNDEILHSIYTHCRNLYKKDLRVASYKIMRNEVLSLITRKFFVENNYVLKALPAKIKLIALSLASLKENSLVGIGSHTNFCRGVGNLLVTIVRKWCWLSGRMQICWRIWSTTL